MNVSIVIPIHNPDVNILDKIKKSVNEQKFSGKKEILFENSGGLAENMNQGIKKAKYDIIVTLHQDCIPVGKDWLRKLTLPIKRKGTVASVSDVELPNDFWKTFDNVAKILSVKEQKVLTPLLDEKGCAYSKEALLKAGLFDSKNFRTAGEDFDMYFKLSMLGKIAYPHTKVLHYNYYHSRSRLHKEYQLANAFGALVRIYGKSMPGWQIGFLRATPFIGWPMFFKGINMHKLKSLALLTPLVLLIAHLQYVRGFWKGFIQKKQTV